METTEIIDTEEVVTTEVQENTIEYSWFWKRVLAYMCDSWFNTLVIPMFVSIYYYYKDGQTLWYKVMGLSIKNSLYEWVKPGGRRLFGRRLAKWYGLLLLVLIIWFVSSALIPWADKSILALEEPWSFALILNRIIWTLGLIWLFLLVFHRVLIPFHKKSKWVHDMIAKTEVWKVWEKKTGWLVAWIILFVIWIIFWVVSAQNPWVADLYQISK